MYKCIIDQFSMPQWAEYCSTFSAMNLYQAGLYGQLNSNSMFRSCSRVAAFDGAQVKALVQLRIKGIPFSKVGVAEADWAPVWDCEGDGCHQILGFLLDSLRREYCLRRQLELRISPRSTFSEEKDGRLEEVFTRHGFHKNLKVRPYHTVVIDLSKSLKTIRAEFHQKWRNQLNVAERATLKVEYGTSIEHFDRFHHIYKEMWKTKRFPTGVRLPIVRQMQKNMLENEKCIITLVHDEKKDIGATVCCAQGDTMHYFLGATLPNERDRGRPGYLLQWLHIKKAKELGMRWYDLGGYDDDNQAIARFKKRTNGCQIVFPGQFEAFPNQNPSKLYVVLENSFRKTRRMVTGR